MTTPSHQTIRLSKGRHVGPADGACVMELASMLAGERFTDRPRSVCPVVASFLRSYNDTVDDGRRQDLYRFAALAVGTAGDHAASAQRAQLCVEWLTTGAPPERQVHFNGLDRRLALSRRGRVGWAVRIYARDTTDESHAAALRFLDLLLAVGAPHSEPPCASSQRTVSANTTITSMPMSSVESSGDDGKNPT